jgi:hypothetical protein
MTRATAALALLAAALYATGSAAQEMPDPSQIHGRGLPAGELPVGTVTVRVAREAVGNYVPGQKVTLLVAGTPRVAATDDSGRAEFSGLPPSAQVTAETVVDGERLVSEPLVVPASGGLRVMLFAGLARAAERRAKEEAESRAAPPVRGVVVLGGQTRIVTEFQSDVLRVFYTLDILNNARTRVDIGGPFVLDLPEGATAAAALEGAPEAASVNGRRVTVEGPFDPGTTRVEVGFELQYSGSEHTFVQTWPVAVQEWMVGVERVAGASASSSQFARTEERVSEQGSVFLVAAGAPMAAGSSFTMQLSNLPAASRVAPTVTVLVALGIIALGVWLSLTARRGEVSTRSALESRQRTLFARLEELERAHRAGTVGAEKYAGRRERLVRDLEQVYAELDGDPMPRGGGEGLAA